MYLLTKHEHLRDDDNRLIATIYFEVAKSKNKEIKENKYSAMDFLGDFAKGLYPSPESIRRCRQKVQEQNPQVRGKSYKQRHEKEQDFRIQIKSI
jgi:hypothetical protein